MDNIRKVRSYKQAYDIGRLIVNTERRKYPSKRLCCHFDLDSTLLNEDRTFTYKNVKYLHSNPAIVNLLHRCRANKLRICLITARPSTSRAWTVQNLNLLNIPYDDLIFACNKPKAKKNMIVKHKCTFVISVGDQPIDVQGGKNVAGIGIALNIR